MANWICIFLVFTFFLTIIGQILSTKVFVKFVCIIISQFITFSTKKIECLIPLPNQEVAFCARSSQLTTQSYFTLKNTINNIIS